MDISLVCAVGRHAGDLAGVHREFREALERTGRSGEFLYVLDGPWTGAEQNLAQIAEHAYPVRVFRMARGFGEATALQFGFEQARGRFVITIPDRLQIESSTLERIVERLERGDEVVVTRREPRTDNWINRLQSSVFHALVTRLTGQDFKDLTCCLRGFTREAALKMDLYGDMERFIPVIAVRCGYGVVELPGAQHGGNRALRLRGPGIYARRLLDILNIYFLTKFTRKPLRFFGLIGLAIGSFGAVICSWLAVQRLFLDIALAGRPLLLLGVLMLVLGVQVTSLGLLGEIIIFLSSRRDTPEVREVGGPEDLRFPAEMSDRPLPATTRDST